MGDVIYTSKDGGDSFGIRDGAIFTDLRVDCDSMLRKANEARKALKLRLVSEAMELRRRLNPKSMMEESALMRSTNRAERRAMRKRAKG